MPLPGQLGGEWIFSPPPDSGFTRVILGINNGVAPVFPAPLAGALNIEVFTNPTVAGQPGVPNPDAGFLASLVDGNFGIDSGGFLVGTDVRLGTGDYLIVDSVTGATTQSAAKITLGTGSQTVVGATFDTLVGGQQSVMASQILSALVGNETVVGGAISNQSIWGGADRPPLGGPI